jgi:hypothetical protein
MTVLEMLGVVVALTVIALMASAPALMKLHEEHPVRDRRRDESNLLSDVTERSNRFDRFADIKDHHIV